MINTLSALLKPSIKFIHCWVCLAKLVALVCNCFASASKRFWFKYAWATLELTLNSLNIVSNNHKIIVENVMTNLTSYPTFKWSTNACVNSLDAAIASFRWCSKKTFDIKSRTPNGFELNHFPNLPSSSFLMACLVWCSFTRDDSILSHNHKPIGEK